MITGGARGLGFATGRRLREEGARVVLLDRDAGGLRGATSRLGSREDQSEGRSANVESHRVDVTDESSVRSAMNEVLQRHGRIDVLVNNAGIFPHTPFEDLDFTEWRRVLSTNLDSVYLCTSAVYPSMRKHGYGRIVNVSSATFFIGYPEMTPYIASKGGVIGFTRALASEAGPYGITVNTITPGLIETEGALEEDEDGTLFDEIVGGQAIKRRGRPEDIAACVAYLASPTAGFITGQIINVDGGHRYH